MKDQALRLGPSPSRIGSSRKDIVPVSADALPIHTALHEFIQRGQTILPALLSVNTGQEFSWLQNLPDDTLCLYVLTVSLNSKLD